MTHNITIFGRNIRPGSTPGGFSDYNQPKRRHKLVGGMSREMVRVRINEYMQRKGIVTTTALTALATHLEIVSKNSRGRGGHGWTYDEEIAMLRTAAEEIKELRVALTQLVKAEDASCDKFEAKEIDAIEAAIDRANLVLGKPSAAPPNS